MKIAIIGSRGIPARYGGFEVFVERLAEKLPELGLELEIYCKKELKNYSFSRKGVKRHFVPCPAYKPLEKLCLSNLAMLRASFSRVNAILLLGVSGVPFAILARVFGKKIILNPDGIEWKRKKWGFTGRLVLKFLERIGVKISKNIVVDSRTIGDYIKSKYKRDTTFIPYGTELPEFTSDDWNYVTSKYSLKPKEYYTVIGRDVPENNFSIIIEGFLNSASRKKLVIVSDLGDSYKKYGGRERLIFTGPIYDRARLFAIRTNAYGHIHGHSVGGTNPSLLEAIASGNMVFAYDVPFNREVLEDSGLYFSSSDELTNLINSMERKKDISTFLESIRKHYNKILNEKYNWDIVAKKYYEILSW